MRRAMVVLAFLTGVMSAFGDEAFGGLGVTIQSAPEGVAVVEVIPGSPAAALGILPGDRITAVGGTSLQGMELENAVARLRGEPGSRVSLSVARVTTGQFWNVDVVRAELRVKELDAEALRSWYGGSPVSVGDMRYYADLQAEAGFSLLGVLEDGRLAQREPAPGAKITSVYAGSAPKVVPPPAIRFARVQLKGFARNQIQIQVDERSPMELTLLDLEGNVLARWELPNPDLGLNSLNWDGSALAIGTYTLRVSAVNGKAAWRVQLR